MITAMGLGVVGLYTGLAYQAFLHDRARSGVEVQELAVPSLVNKPVPSAY